MSLLSLLFNTKTNFGINSVGVIELDALLNENTTLSSKITEYPVEDGTVISDHIALDSEKLTIDGVISGAGTLFNPKSGRSELINAKETLRQLHKSRELISISTGLDVYDDFAIENCTISRNSDSGEVYNVSLELRKINKVTLRTEDMPPENTGGRVTEKAGKTRDFQGKAQTQKVSPEKRTQLSDITGLSKGAR